jgi:hypothetical protein
VQLVVDYLLTVPEIDRAHIAYHRLFARRLRWPRSPRHSTSASPPVIAGSTGVGGVLPWRLSGERGMGEGVESTTRSFPLWFAPQLRFFSGREDRLPVDANLLVALVAPRAFLMNYGLNDEVSNVWANEQCYASRSSFHRTRPARTPGRDAPARFSRANDIEGSIDWLDIQFGRTRRTWRNDLLFPWDFAEWRKTIGDTIDLTKACARRERHAPPDATRAAVEWLLGPTPAKFVAPAFGRGRLRRTRRRHRRHETRRQSRPTRPDVAAWVIARNSASFGWNDPARSAADTAPHSFWRRHYRRSLFSGRHTRRQKTSDRHLAPRLQLPARLHVGLPPGLASGSRARAGRLTPVLAFDQCGFGSRMARSGRSMIARPIGRNSAG